MLARSHRHLLVITLMVLAISFTWWQRFSVGAQLPDVQSVGDARVADDEPAPPEHVYFVDVEGWYQITSRETAVRSHYDLTGTTTDEMARRLPPSVGDWEKTGEDRFIGDDPAVVYYLKNPTVALERVYKNQDGRQVTLAVVGNEGEDSFLLFSHTPETCYPGQLWQIVEGGIESTLLDDRPMYAQYLLTEHTPTHQRLLVLYWYLWGSPERGSEDGVLSMRVNLFLAQDQSPEDALTDAWDFVRALFPTTAPWTRF
jgi:hypothetical protein